MRKYLPPEGYQKIRDMFSDGMTKKGIADQLGISPSTVAGVIKNPGRNGSFDKQYYQNANQGFAEIDFSTLPDTVLFQFSKHIDL